MDELICLLMLIAQGYNRIATIYPIPKYMTGKYRKEYDCYKVQIDYEAIRLGRNLKKAILICNNHELKQVMITSINQVYKIFVHSYDIKYEIIKAHSEQKAEEFKNIIITISKPV